MFRKEPDFFACITSKFLVLNQLALNADGRPEGLAKIEIYLVIILNSLIKS
jgi:hypothetical protein